jgi:hypothetical protein
MARVLVLVNVYVNEIGREQEIECNSVKLSN